MLRLSNLGAYAMLPVRLLHEGTHVAAALPWAADWRVEFDRDQLTTHVVFRDSTPTWAVYLVHLAPTLTGTLAAVVVATLVATGRFEVTVPSLLDALYLAVVAWAWWAYAWPSERDRQPERTTSPAPSGGDA